MLTLPVYNAEGKEIDSLKLDSAAFNGDINTAVLHQIVNAYRANQRKGLAATKTRGEVSGGGRKPWKQKGTGRARIGSTRSPLWRHGGVIFGPHPKDFSISVPDRLKTEALKSSFNEKLKEGNLVILDSFKLETSKTKDALRIFKELKLNNPDKKHKFYSVLLLLAEADKKTDNFRLALRNINFLNVNLAGYTHAYEVLRHKKVVITKDALKVLTARLKK